MSYHNIKFCKLTGHSGTGLFTQEAEHESCKFKASLQLSETLSKYKGKKKAGDIVQGVW